jgi:hypothetical protein
VAAPTHPPPFPCSSQIPCPGIGSSPCDHCAEKGYSDFKEGVNPSTWWGCRSAPETQRGRAPSLPPPPPLSFYDRQPDSARLHQASPSSALAVVGALRCEALTVAVRGRSYRALCLHDSGRASGHRGRVQAACAPGLLPVRGDVQGERCLRSLAASAGARSSEPNCRRPP